MTERTHRACIGCRGEGWIDQGTIDGWPVISPCPECRPVPAARLDNGDYRADAPVRAATDNELMMADRTPRTALWPLSQLTEPGPGYRKTNPTPKTTRQAEQP